MKELVKLSVRNLVEFIMRGGDIDNRFASFDKDAMLAGTKAHRRIQKSMKGGYRAEVPLKFEIEFEEYTLCIEGRADGIITEESVIMEGDTIVNRTEVCIDEIKGVHRELEYLTEPVVVHKAQAMVYAYIYATQNDIPSIGVQMTYCNLETEDVKRFKEQYGIDELREWFNNLITEYKKWADFQTEEKVKRNASIKKVEFPFEYRPGQRDLAVSVYKVISQKRNLFIQAPTGVGKTISTVFPAVKAIGEERGEKIFYLTAKTITRTVAEEAFNILREKQGLYFRTVTLTAKEKVCLCDKMDCNPVNCECAKGHYDRVNDAVYDILTHESVINRELVISYAKKHNVCPFEFSLDITNWVDGIICDYNYVFDPNVKLKRYFSEGMQGEYIFLVDEAHNLVERAREMYSASLYKEDFLRISKIIDWRSRKITKYLESCNKNLLELKRECADDYAIIPNTGTFGINLMRLAVEFDYFLEENKEFEGRKEVLEFYLNIKFFLTIQELVDENYRIYSEIGDDGRFMIKLFCVQVADNLKKCLEKGISTVFFSATLLPIIYYKEMLSGNREDYAIYAPSPFDTNKRLLAIAQDVSSKYTRRGQEEYLRIYKYILTVAKARAGNYIAFFPSYSMMQEVYDIATEHTGDMAEDAASDNDNSTDINFVIQNNSMTEEEREEFLGLFDEKRDDSMVAFCVLGGSFSEGIDLKNDRLVGTIIVGTGLPMICNERKILSRYYDELCGNGFEYAYRYPGFNKVMQAAGRVIRTDEDEGVIMLLDYRFMDREYRFLFPREWDDYKKTVISDSRKLLSDFWDDRKNDKKD
ncbi:MAG: ATP-dependent DNA helicase [Lachnospiraceae bacterium]|nr:ATP-dependent DNA helicase [Lachnospiraceae bacterium]